jgi:hypothetical protein
LKKGLKTLQHDYRETKIQNLRSAGTAQLCLKMLKLLQDKPLLQIQQLDKDFDLNEEEKIKQDLSNKSQISTIIKDLQAEISAVISCEKCLILEYKRNTGLLTDGSGLDINTSQNAWLGKMVRSGEVTCIQETTKERIFIAKTLSKEFGLRIFNAAFVPYYMTLAQVK